MYSDVDTVTLTFIFNLIAIVIFSIIYSSIPPHNFEPLNPKDKLTYLDFLFYALTIQSSIGLPDVTALSDLAKSLAMIQQLILMGSGFILIRLFFERERKK
jgi:hypothetical protein